MVEAQGSVIEGDNLEAFKVLPDNSVSLVIFDPPFNSEGEYDFRPNSKDGEWTPANPNPEWEEELKNNHKLLYDFICISASDKSSRDWLIFVAIRLLEIPRILKDDGFILVKSSVELSSSLHLVLNSVFGGDKKAMECKQLKRLDNPNSGIELVGYVIVFMNTKSAIERLEGIAKATVGSGKTQLIRSSHNTPLDTTAYTTLIDHLTNEEEVVLDAFCGKGENIVSIIKMKRKWIGVDIREGSHIEVTNHLQEKLGGAIISTEDTKNKDRIVPDGTYDDKKENE